MSGNDASEADNRKLMDAWDAYNKAVEECRNAITATERFKSSALHRASGYRVLMQAQAMAYNQLLAPALTNPRVYSHTFWNSTLLTVGLNSGDCVYSYIPMDGKLAYRITYKPGNSKVSLVQTYSHMHGHPDQKLLGNYDLCDFPSGKNGEVEIIFSSQKQEGNWIPLTESSSLNYVMIRRFLGDWFDDTGDLSVELLQDPAPEYPLDENLMAERILLAAGFIRYQVKSFILGVYDSCIKFGGGKNQFFCFDGKDAGEILASSATTYAIAALQCESDAAIIVEMEVPDSSYWGFQLGNVWSETLENVFHQSDINMERAAIDSDGKFRLVCSLQDPGVPNWLDMVGNHECIITMRNYKECGENPVPPPTLEKVKLEDLSKFLPNDTATITPEQRESRLKHRHQGFTHLYDSFPAVRN